ncbi:hypothetical protein [Simiduia agarivorans]|uniref:Uncharacterized protein n=1 Tax=Simiduia agarivorans (strain DSM 21679 / JCM 13881 / BCRC 17597 / SA1) TaxID=1117647 RepID=R9S5P0_SIMAS|nr:hypothetical protein [Simiduia agarivorans]AGN11314.1 hypothetical protein M5M_09567 [Simiduia agarivorans SA1 = DSM 21679]
MVRKSQQAPLLVAVTPETLRQLLAEGRLGAADVRCCNAQQRQLIKRWCLENLRARLC